MSKSAQLRSSDWRAILRLVGECRDLGDDRDAWRLHFSERMAALVDADQGHCGEMRGLRSARPTSIGVTRWRGTPEADPAALAELYGAIQRTPTLYGSILRYFERLAEEDGASHARRDLIADRDWYPSTDYDLIQRTLGMDHVLWCFRSIPGTGGDEYSGLVLDREAGRPDFGARALSIAREAQATLVPLVGGPLARFSEPSPTDLAPRARQVLACLLEGDGDKQVAARLRLSAHTVNEYTKQIYRHFGVRSRTELLARWIRRGWGRPPTWTAS